MTWLPGASVQKIIFAVCLLFITLIGLSIGQYQMISQNRKIAAASSRMLFQFTTIKEFVTKALLDGRYADLQHTVVELENLNESVQHIVQNPLIPAQLKATLLNRLDLSGAVILVRQIVSLSSADSQKIARLQEDIRIAGEQFLQFDRMIADHVKRKMVGYQSFVIGVLLFSVLFLAQVLFFIYLKLVAPLKSLKGWLIQMAEEDNKAATVPPRLGWLSDIGRLVPLIKVDDRRQARREFPFNFRFATLGQLACGVSHEINDAVNGLLNYQELALDSMDSIGAGERTREARQMLVAAGVEAEKISGKVKLLLDAALFDQRKGSFTVQQLWGETMTLLRSRLRSDGVKVEPLFEPDLPRIHCSYGMARLVCLQLILWLGDLMSAVADRRIEIRAENRFRDGRPLVRLTLFTTVAGATLADLDGEGQGGGAAGTAVYSWRCLVLLKDYLHQEGGDLQLAAADGGTSIIVDFPAERSEASSKIAAAPHHSGISLL